MNDELDYATAVQRGRLHVGAMSGHMWELGDIASRVRTVYGDETITRLADDIGLKGSTLLNYRTVARAYAPAERSEAVSFAVHEVFAPEPDRAELVRRYWTVSEARAEVARRRGRDTEPGLAVDLEHDEPGRELTLAAAERAWSQHAAPRRERLPGAPAVRAEGVTEAAQRELEANWWWAVIRPLRAVQGCLEDTAAALGRELAPAGDERGEALAQLDRIEAAIAQLRAAVAIRQPG